MRILSNIVLVGTVLAAASDLSATEEDLLRWVQVRVVCSPTKQAGTVVFEAQVDGEAGKAASGSAFGERFVVGATSLRKLDGFSLSTLSMADEADAETGEYVVSAKLRRVYRKSDKLFEEYIWITVTKDKGLSVTSPEVRELGPHGWRPAKGPPKKR